MSNFKELVRLGKDAEVRHTAKGEPVTGFRAAFDNGYGDNKKTEWLDCSAWGERFTKVAEYLTKGSLVLVEGEIGTREHEGKTYLTLRVSDVRLTGKADGSRGGGPVQERGEKPVRGTARTEAPAAAGGVDDDDIPFITNRGTY